jgi:hypothetical protein
LPELMRIDAAAQLLQRETDTLRKWADAGVAPDGTKLDVYEDKATGRRCFDAVQIRKVHAALFGRWTRKRRPGLATA